MVWNVTAHNNVELPSGVTLSLGTVRFTSGLTATGAGVPLWGANCPAGTVSAPYTWIRVVVPDGSIAYIPAYK